jgi:tRNA/rRNA methyltransferase
VNRVPADKLAIVLMEPQQPGNVGMVCRAMKNMGLKDLRLVNPCPLDHEEAIKFAVSARDLLEEARIYPSLEDALADSSLTVATTRRHGKYRQEIQTPGQVIENMAPLLRDNRAAFVFGREDSGLTTAEVAMCRWQATIPTAEFGSLNLAQAVLVFCYELFTRLDQREAIAAEPRALAATESSEGLFGQMERTLTKIGFLNPQNPGHLMKSIRRILLRAEMDDREVAILRGMMTQIDWAAHEFKGKK